MRYRFDFAPTPFGDALVVLSDDGIVSFDLTNAEDPTVPWLLENVTAQLRAAPVEAPGAADELAHVLASYFDGERVDFRDHVTLDWQLVEGFHLKALRVINDIAWGQTLSYGDVAALAGHPRAARAVGTACKLTPLSLIVPVHRVVRSDGSPGEFGAHPERKRYLLDLEAGRLR